MKGAIIIPTYQESRNITAVLKRLQWLRNQWLLIVVDGGSRDDTVRHARPLCDIVTTSTRGRASQQNEGAFIARQTLGINGVLVFLHADCRLPDTFKQVMTDFQRSGKPWGRFDVALSGTGFNLRLIEFLMNHRSRLTGIATGDQALFFQAAFFWELAAFPMQPLMEDVAISARARARAKPFCAYDRVLVSSRKWEQEGVWRTVFLMWFCRAAYFFGVRTERIHQWYYGSRE
ncbi:MAG: TIGR04283 family arsenosugar biosynthesis glycosyltransferase [Ketobacteraceae bacterium]|nr:TIGR04283 family arsenosugar biosynthesis glycosyltransferase [Ketobacteraceae bacterium]